MDESPLAHAPLKVRFRLGALTFLRHQFHRKYLLMGLPLAPPIGEISYLLSGKRIATGTVNIALFCENSLNIVRFYEIS